MAQRIKEGVEVYDFWYGSNWGNGVVTNIDTEHITIKFAMKGIVKYTLNKIENYLRIVS